MVLSVDQDALNILECVREAHDRVCGEVSPFGSIFLLFAHDLMIHFSGILLHRQAEREYLDKVNFPLVTKQYAQYPYRIDDTELEGFRRKTDLKMIIRELGLSKVAMGYAVPIERRREWLTSKLINLLGSQKPFVKAFLPRRDVQIQALRDLIESLCKEFEIPEAQNVWDNWRRYLSKHTTAEQLVILEHSVILGTRNNIQNRKLASNFLQQDREVVALTHGEVANSVMDEPPFGYAERTLCSVLVDYGDFDVNGDYNRPWIPPRGTIYRDGIVAKYVHSPHSTIKLPEAKSALGLYIPTINHGNTLYGPFHAYEDVKYCRWQVLLTQMIEGLTYKVHPKTRAEPIRGVSLEKRPLEACIRDYDYLVFDYFATGAMLGLVSDKPVIYCDIGLRNLDKDFVNDLKMRCEYVKIDLDNIDPRLIKKRLSNALSSPNIYSNEVMRKYVFCESTEFSWPELFWQLHSGERLSTA